MTFLRSGRAGLRCALAGSVARRRGFTLLEMLVAMAIMVVVAGSLYATLHIAFTARRTALAAVEEVRKTEGALGLVRADLESAVLPVGILAGALVGEEGVDALGRTADSVLFYAAAPGEEGMGDIRGVALTCEEDDEGGTGQMLVRRITTNLLSPTTQETEGEVLCRGVYAFALRYWDGIDWLTLWDSTTQDNQLPLAIEVTLQLVSERPADAGKGGYTMTAIVRMPLSSIQPGVGMEVAAQ
jgi:general secretion pathway protein J